MCTAPAVAPVAALHEHTAGLVVVADRAQPVVRIAAGACYPRCCCCCCLAATYLLLSRLLPSCCCCYLYSEIQLPLLLLLVRSAVCSAYWCCSSTGCCRCCLMAWQHLQDTDRARIAARLRWQCWPGSTLRGNTATADATRSSKNVGMLVGTAKACKISNSCTPPCHRQLPALR
jgi:hypothetical protein